MFLNPHTNTGARTKQVCCLLIWAHPTHRLHKPFALILNNTSRVDVVCPSFVSNCLETLEEIAIEGKNAFTKAGGREFHYIPCLNEYVSQPAP